MSKPCKAAILGAAGGIGQPLSLLMKQNTVITDLALYDIVPVVHGVAADVSHINTPSVVSSYTKDDDGLKKTLDGAGIVVIPAGVPRKPGMTRDDLFKINASIVRDLASAIADHCPQAFVCVISNPVNSTVPIVAEVMRKRLSSSWDEKRLFGVTTLDVVRASTFSAAASGKPLESLSYKIPVIGGHSGTTIIPLLSLSSPALPAQGVDIPALVHRIQFGGDEVVKAKDGAGSATLSMAYAGYRFAQSLIAAAWEGKSGVTEMAYIYTKGKAEVSQLCGEEIDYFSAPVELGPSGVTKLGLPLTLNDYEKGLVKEAVTELKGNITKGVSFVDAKL